MSDEYRPDEEANIYATPTPWGWAAAFRSARLALAATGQPQRVHGHAPGANCRAVGNFHECELLRAGPTRVAL